MRGPCQEKGMHKMGIFGSVKTFSDTFYSPAQIPSPSCILVTAWVEMQQSLPWAVDSIQQWSQHPNRLLTPVTTDPEDPALHTTAAFLIPRLLLLVNPMICTTTNGDKCRASPTPFETGGETIPVYYPYTKELEDKLHWREHCAH